jgi:multicomponent Na+:H+ antiporter subunit D
VAELHPGLVLLVGALLVAALPRRVGAPITVAVATLALVVTSTASIGTRVTYQYWGIELTLMRVDELARPFALVFAAVTLLGAIYGWSTMGTLERASGLATAGAGIGVVLAGDLLTLFLFWELKVTTVVLLVLSRGRAVSSAAAMRYLWVHLTGGVVLLGGVIWHRTSTGSLAFDELGRSGHVADPRRVPAVRRGGPAARVAARHLSDRDGRRNRAAERVHDEVGGVRAGARVPGR